MIGKTLVHYEITAQIGKGGMGEVYQAKDTKLGRDVAIKVLPEEFALDKDRVARLQREAKLLASLNHPNIAAIYGLEESEGIHFLVMELIEGDTLRDRIKSGPIPVEEALKLALQMAEALEAAHEKGVIHRDLKPANIKVTPEGKVKILDFGLAKAYVGDQENMSPMDSPTISAAATQQGVILGTAAYMSPEQAKGKSVDKRADIWAFGCVLYEMLTGKSLFSGEDVSSTLARVLEREPDFSTLPQMLHSRIQLMLERCLKKNPKDRYSGISDARVDVQEVLADPASVLIQQAELMPSRRKSKSILLWLAVTLVLGAIISGLAVWKLKPPEPRHVMRFDYDLPLGQQFGIIGGIPAIAISPDGNLLTYSTPEGLYLRSMGDSTANLLGGTEEADFPFFSPDGKWIGYISQTDGKLKKVTVGGSAPVTLCDASVDGGFSWTSDNRIIQGSGEGIWWVSADGGQLERLFEEKGNILGLPQLLPDGESVLFTTGSSPPHKIMVHSLKTGESKVLYEGGHARYIKTGHIVYGVENILHAIPFDPDTLEIVGGPVSLVEGVLRGTWAWQYAVSDSGTLVYIPGTTSGINQNLVWVDQLGNEELLEVEPGDYRDFKISPDGSGVALTVNKESNTDIWVLDLLRNNMRRLTFHEVEDNDPLWTPDSQRILFQSSREGSSGIYHKAANGTGGIEKLGSASDREIFPWSWSSDGNTLVLWELSYNPVNNDIGILSKKEDPVLKSLLNEEYHEGDPQVSPDGRWLAYHSNESGKWQVYVLSFPEVDKGKWQVSINGGISPRWSPDGQKLYYRNDSSVLAVTVETEPTFSPRNEEALFEGDYFILSRSSPIERVPWDVHPDGKRFLMIKPASTTEDGSELGYSSKINIVLNWFEELKQRVPVD
jgi:serine/threonine protein kinase